MNDIRLMIEDRVRDGDPAYATAYAILKLADEVAECAAALKRIGNGDIYGPGALEFIGMQLRDGVRVVVSE